VPRLLAVRLELDQAQALLDDLAVAELPRKPPAARRMPSSELARQAR
jgi:hypothetical protein